MARRGWRGWRGGRAESAGDAARAEVEGARSLSGWYMRECGGVAARVEGVKG